MGPYYPTNDFAAESWRTRTLIVSGIAGIELVALIAIAVLVLGKGWFQHERAAAAAAARTRPAAHVTPRPATRPVRLHRAAVKPMVAKSQTGVLVLNGNGQTGAAGAEAQVIRSHGYPVTGVGNAKRNDYAATIVMYRPGYNREAQRLARELHVPIVSALDGVLLSQLKGARAVLIVGR